MDRRHFHRVALENPQEDEERYEALYRWFGSSSIFRDWIPAHNVKLIEVPRVQWRPPSSSTTTDSIDPVEDLLLFSSIPTFYRTVCEYCAVLFWTYDDEEEETKGLIVLGEILPEYYALSPAEGAYMSAFTTTTEEIPRARRHDKNVRGVMLRDVRNMMRWITKNRSHAAPARLFYTGCLNLKYTYRTDDRTKRNGKEYWMWLPSLPLAERFRQASFSVVVTLGESKISWRLGLIDVLSSLVEEEIAASYRHNTVLREAVDKYLQEAPDAPSDLASPEGREKDRQSFMICMLLAAENEQFHRKMVLAETLLIRYKVALFPREDEIHEMLFRNRVDQRLLDFLLDEDGASTSNVGAQEKRLLMRPYYGGGYFQRRQFPTRVYMVPIDEYPLPRLGAVVASHAGMFPSSASLSTYATANHISPIVRGLVAITYPQVEEWLMYTTYLLLDGVRVHLHQQRASRAYKEYAMRADSILSGAANGRRRPRLQEQRKQLTRIARQAIAAQPFYEADDEMCGAMDDKEMGVLRSRARLVGLKNCQDFARWDARNAASELLEEQHVATSSGGDGAGGGASDGQASATVDFPPCVNYLRTYSENASTVGAHPDHQARKFLLTFLAEAQWSEEDVLPFYKSLFDACRCSKHPDISAMTVDEFSRRTEYGTYIKSVFRDHGRSVKSKKTKSGEERRSGMHCKCDAVMGMGFCPFYASTKHGLPGNVDAPTYARETLLKNSGASVEDIEDLCGRVQRTSGDKEKVKRVCTEVFRRRHPDMRVKYDIFSPNGYFKLALYAATSGRQSDALSNVIRWT